MRFYNLFLFGLLFSFFASFAFASDVDLSKYFNDVRGVAVFYEPTSGTFIMSEETLAKKRSSPCSTFKIVNAYIALEENIISLDSPAKKWSGEKYWNEDWNKDTNLKDAFGKSCIWYFKRLVNEAGKERVAKYLKDLSYGNRDISDWDANLDKSETHQDLKGFWIESSLKISPVEETLVLAKIMKNGKAETVETLKELMFFEDGAKKIYGKTGMGLKNGKVADAWYVGFYEYEAKTIFFAVRLDDENNKLAKSSKAREIATEIIKNETLFE